MTIKVVLFRKNDSFISKCIAKVTGSDITHSAVLYKDVMFDSSEVRGNFGRANQKDYKGRMIEVYPLGASEQQFQDWLFLHSGKKYDYKGVIGWFFWKYFGNWTKNQKLNSKSRVYCFEATADLISRVSRLKYDTHISGADLKRTLGQAQFIGPIEEYLK